MIGKGDHCLPQEVFSHPQTPNINPYSTYKMARLCILYILLDAQFNQAGVNTEGDMDRNMRHLLADTKYRVKTFRYYYRVIANQKS